jgi:hypothetical protein
MCLAKERKVIQARLALAAETTQDKVVMLEQKM